MGPDTSSQGLPRHLRLLALIPLITLTSGCLSHLYEVPRSELYRQTRLPPQERGQDVFAVQQLSTADEPDPAPAWPMSEGEPPPGYVLHSYGNYWVPDFYVSYGAPTYYQPPSNAVTPAVHGASPVGSVRSTSGGGGGSIGNLNGIDKALVVAIVVGVAVGVALAATEGARFEGSVAVHPHHPVHLIGPRQERIVALDELTEADLTGVDHGLLVGPEGAGMWLRDSAPLNRQGFSYQLAAGNDALALPDRSVLHSPGFRFALGYYPHKRFGLLADTRLQTYNDLSNAYYNVRLGLEAQWYPLSLWRLHLGGFAGGGQSWSASEGATLPVTSGQRPYVSFGALAEFELTTRLGLTARLQNDWLPNAPGSTRPVSTSWMVGLAIY